MSTTLQCPNLVAYNSVERVCLLGKFPADCAACTCPDKHIIEATTTTMGTLNPPHDAPSLATELERAADGYAWSHDTIGVHRDTFATTDVPPDKMVRVPVADEIRTAVLFGARWQQRRDAELIRQAHMQGMERMREQLLQEAVPAEINYFNLRGLCIRPDVAVEDLADVGDRVKLIIIKED